jgi:hypothetical protein
MGLLESPYRSLQWQVRLKFEVYGNRKDLNNPFHWDKVVWNLPNRPSVSDEDQAGWAFGSRDL